MNAIKQKMIAYFNVNCFDLFQNFTRDRPGCYFYQLMWQLVNHFPFKYRYTGSTEAQALASRRRRLSLPKVWWAIRMCSTPLHQQARLRHRVQWTTSLEETVINSQDLKHRCALLSKKLSHLVYLGAWSYVFYEQSELLSTAKSLTQTLTYIQVEWKAFGEVVTPISL